MDRAMTPQEEAEYLLRDENYEDNVETVAAALQAKQDEIERLKAEAKYRENQLLGDVEMRAELVEAAMKDIDQLRAELAAAEQRLKYLEENLRRNGDMYWLGGGYRRGPFLEAIDRAIAAAKPETQNKNSEGEK